MVCSDIGPCSEVLGNGEAGVLVPAQNPAAMADAIRALWEDPARRADLARRAFRFAAERYSSRRAAMDVLRAFVD